VTPARAPPPSGGPDHRGASLWSDTGYSAKAIRDEVRRTVLREAEERYRNELLEVEECMLLLDRVRKLRREFGLSS